MTAFTMRAYVDSELEGVRAGAENLEFAPAEASASEQRKNPQVFWWRLGRVGVGAQANFLLSTFAR